MATTHLIGEHRVSEQVLGAVREASRRTGADFDYMLAKAAQESGFRADAEARTSSATGLYQFIESTWLEMVRDHGARHGLGALAGQIETGIDGRPEVADPHTRRRILDLRRDPRLNAIMAGELANDNKAYLERRLGGEIGGTDLYLAHFLGAEDAAMFLRTWRAAPDRSAAELFPAAARANRGVFYEAGTGAARSLDAVYRHFAHSLGGLPADTDRSPDPAWTPMTHKRWTGAAKTIAAAPLPAPATMGREPLALWTLLTLNALPPPGG